MKRTFGIAAACLALLLGCGPGKPKPQERAPALAPGQTQGRA
jgi:hypothetical protein